MQRKIFLSLDVPEKVKLRLTKTTEKWKDLPIKWTRKKNLHLTLSFLGYVDESSILEISNLVEEVSQNHEVFDLEFEEIKIFPSIKEPRAVVLWGRENTPLKNLINDLEKKLSLSSAERKTFCPHITLGRFKKLKWQELKEKPILQEDFSVNITISAIDIIANNFGEARNEYITIKSSPLQ